MSTEAIWERHNTKDMDESAEMLLTIIDEETQLLNSS